MSKQVKTFASEIVPVSPMKAFLGFAVDFFVSFGLLMLGTFFLAPVLQRAVGYDKVASDMVSMVAESKLFATKSGDTFEITPYLYGSGYTGKIDEHGKIKTNYGPSDEAYVGKYPFELYEDVVYSYLMDFCYGGEGTLFSTDGYAQSELKTKTKAEVGRYIGENYFKITDSDSSYYRFATDEEGNPLYDQKPVHNEKNTAIQGLNDEKTALVSATALYTFFVTSANDTYGAYEIAMVNFINYEPLYLAYFATLEYIIYLCKIPIRLLPPLIFFILIPLILRDGKSIGRLLTSTAVIDKNGFCARKWRIFVHQGILFLPWFLSLIPLDVLALFSVIILYLIEFLISNVTKDKRSLHEKIAGTLTVNDEKSSYFKNKEDMESFKRDNPSYAEEAEVVDYVPDSPKKEEKKELIDEEPTYTIEPDEKENAPESVELSEDDFLDDKKK